MTVFSGLSFDSRAGTFAAVMGPSGVGKSTLLHLLGGIDRPGRGTGRGLRPGDRGAARRARAPGSATRSVGFVFQFHHLLPEFTAEENVAMPHRIAGVPDAEARRQAARAARARRPRETGGTTGRAPSRAASSSASPSRARSRAARGSSWPTSRPATSTRRAAQAVFELLRELHRERGMTTVLVTHNPDLASRCDRLFTMSREGITPSPGLPERG